MPERAEVSLHSPGGDVGPLPHRVERPRGTLPGVAGGAGIRDAVPIRRGRGDESERVAPDAYGGDGLGNLRHVARHARAARAVGPMMGVLLQRSTGTGLQLWPVTLGADGIARTHKLRSASSPVRIVARVTAHALGVHPACDEVIPLHPVLVRRPFGPVGKCRFPQPVFLQPPDIGKSITCRVADGPVVVLALERVLARLTL